MKIVIIGGTGLIGSKVATRLRDRGHDVIAAAPNTGVNTLTGEGLDEALNGADVVVDVANSPSFEDKAVMDFFETSGRNLLAAEKKAGVRHHVALSVVGTDRLPQSGYLRAKLAQENLIRNSTTPYTIVRSTQFFEFLKGIIESAFNGNEIRLPSAGIQPIAADDVASKVAEVAVRKPLNGITEIAGPALFTMPDLVTLYLARLEDRRTVKIDENATYFGTPLDSKSLVPQGKASLGGIDFEAWMQTVMVQLPRA